MSQANGSYNWANFKNCYIERIHRGGSDLSLPLAKAFKSIKLGKISSCAIRLLLKANTTTTQKFINAYQNLFRPNLPLSVLRKIEPYEKSEILKR